MKYEDSLVLLYHVNCGKYLNGEQNKTQNFSAIYKNLFKNVRFFFPIFICSFASLLLSMGLGSSFGKVSFVMMSVTEIVTFVKN